MKEQHLDELLDILWDGYAKNEYPVINLRALIDALEGLKHGEEYIFYENISALEIREEYNEPE